MALTIFIKDLIVAGKHGVHEHEKKTPQRFKITLEVALADESAASSDDLQDTIDWSRLRDAVVHIVEGRSYDLMERLAGDIAASILEDARAAQVTVVIDKLEAFKTGVPGVRLTAGKHE